MTRPGLAGQGAGMERERGAWLARAWHGRLDDGSGWVLLFVAGFVPWSANTRVAWLTWSWVGACWLAGLMWLGKLALRRAGACGPAGRPEAPWATRWTVGVMLVLSAALAAQVAASLLNPSAVVTWFPDGIAWEHLEARPGWPTTFDRDATASALARYVGLAALFWAMRDWLMGGGEDRPGREGGVGGSPRLPSRMQRVAWTIALSGAAMGVAGIAHRLDKAADLLWLMPLPNVQNSIMFGSFPSRTNAGQYFNVAWPMVLGCWWALQRGRLTRRGTVAWAGPESFLLVGAALMVASAITAASRMAIAVTLGQMLVATGVLGATVRGWIPRLMLAGGLVLALALGWLAQGDFLRQRFSNAFSDLTLTGRTEIWAYARPLADRHPTWGWGAEAFRSKGELHRWVVGSNPEYVHNDWLEARGELGWVGGVMLAALLASIPLLGWTGGSLRCHAAVPWMMALGLAGMMVHARVDHPFHVPALQATWTLVAACLVSARWRGRAR